jgi:hypothetical protein
VLINRIMNFITLENILMLITSLKKWINRNNKNNANTRFKLKKNRNLLALRRWAAA